MIERVCPTCNAGVAIDATVCEECGMALEQPLAVQPRGKLARRLPAMPVRWQRAGKAVALGAVALAVEVGATWLHHRSAARPAPLARRPDSTRVPPATSNPGPTYRGKFVARQRIWETYEGNRLSRRVVEQTLWQFPDD
jgi:hypothetical protein